MKNYKFYLEGLTCQNCGSEIENKTAELPFVLKANLNLVGGYISIESKIDDDAKVFGELTAIVLMIEPEVAVLTVDMHSRKTENNKEKINKLLIARLLLSTLFFVFAVIFHNSPITTAILSIVAYAIIGYDILIKAVKNIINGRVFDENFLMSIASIGAIIIGEYPEAAGVMLFYQIGEYVQSLAVNKSRRRIQDLIEIKPSYANIITSSGISKVDPMTVNVGDNILVKPGEKVPVDGVIIKGNSTLDMSALTGESAPVYKEVGDEIKSGSINKSGAIEISVKSLYVDSTVAKILALIETATEKKAVTESFITKFAKYYTPAVVILALIIGILPPFILSESFGEWAYRGLVFLVVSCPCALVLSIPLTYFSGIGTASRHGILIKGGNYLEALSNVEYAVFDKTGTLTEGKFSVAGVYPQEIISGEELLQIAAHGEFYSNHPIAVSIKEHYQGVIDTKQISDYTEIAGLGIAVLIAGKTVLLGNEKLLTQNGVLVKSSDFTGTVLHISINGSYAGCIVVTDKIKDNVLSLDKLLKSVGVKKTVILTGDNSEVAAAVCSQVGFDAVHAELMPADKVYMMEEILKLKGKNKKVLFVGDGLNDAPVLIRSDIGFAMGGIGSDAAIESADAIILNDDPTKVFNSIKIAKNTKSIAIQNIVFALSIKVLVMVLTVFGYVSMPIAVFADVGVALIAILNASRIIGYAIKSKK